MRVARIVSQGCAVLLRFAAVDIGEVTIAQLYELQSFSIYQPRTEEDIRRKGELIAKIFGETNELKELIDRCTELQQENALMGLKNYDLKRENEGLLKANIALAAEIGNLKRLIELLKTQLKNDSEPTEKLA